MIRPTDDADLRARFEALRQEDATLLPSFAVPRPRPVARHPARWIAAGALAAAAATVLWVLGDRRTGNRIALDLGAAVWAAPTDFLLETPGRDLLREIPQLGGAWRELP